MTYYIRGWDGHDYMPVERFANNAVGAAKAVTELTQRGLEVDIELWIGDMYVSKAYRV